MENRVFFPYVNPELDHHSEVGRERIRTNIVHLFQRMLGLEVLHHGPEVDRAFDLWVAVFERGQTLVAQGDQLLPAHCWYRVFTGPRAIDPQASVLFDLNYGIRSWMAILTYLARQPEFIQY